MGVDLMICAACPVKERLGGGDSDLGNERLVTLRKTRAQVQAVQGALPQGHGGGDPLDREITSVVVTPYGDTERTTTLREMLASTAELEPLATICADCDANIFDDAFGCWTYLSYPIPRSAEEWLMARVEPAERLGGWLLLAGIQDFGWDGAPVAEMRAAGLFESSQPVTAVLKKGLLSRVKVDSNVMLEAVFGPGAPLEPSHCMAILLWFGALAIGGEVPRAADGPELEQLLAAATPDERVDCAELVLGDDTDDAGVTAMQDLLTALHVAWVIDVPLWVSR